ncbi:hypothetical protein [Neotamlana nanhaiensis]|uniref:hypothetical protein n=1 Tax=Neotamlana nanhaiensis TaxID=1382798 RepID=UPI00069CA7B5|nr:hypothetical protein [Tamlana nanhaiensis]
MITTNKTLFSILAFCMLFLSCQKSEVAPNNEEEEEETENPTNNPSNFYYGADLSYVNEMLDCDAVYKNASNV